MKATNKLILTVALIEAITPHATALIEGSGKLWNNARDAFNLALVDFPEADDAAKAVKQVIRDTLNANDGSCRAYFSTLVWLAKAGHDSSAMSMADATDARYPKAVPIAADDFEGQLKRETERSQQRLKKIEQARTTADKVTAMGGSMSTPERTNLLRQVASMLADCDDAELAIIAAEIASTKAQLRSDDTVQEESREALAA